MNRSTRPQSNTTSTIRKPRNLFCKGTDCFDIEMNKSREKPLQTVDFTAPELNRDGSFAFSRFVYEGKDDEWWKLYRIVFFLIRLTHISGTWWEKTVPRTWRRIPFSQSVAFFLSFHVFHVAVNCRYFVGSSTKLSYFWPYLSFLFRSHAFSHLSAAYAAQTSHSTEWHFHCHLFPVTRSSASLMANVCAWTSTQPTEPVESYRIVLTANLHRFILSVLNESHSGLTDFLAVSVNGCSYQKMRSFQ